MSDVKESPWFRRFCAAIDDSYLSYREISRKAGLGENFVNQMMRNGRVPSVVNMLAICEVIGASPVEILTGSELDPETLEVFRLFNRLPADHRASVLNLMMTIVRSEKTPEDKESSAG